MKKNPNRFDDGFQSYLTEDVNFVGNPPLPEIIAMNNISIPKALIPFNEIENIKNKRGHIHFYQHDKIFAKFIANVKNYLPLLSQFDGVITPDCSIAIGQLEYLQITNTYFNRAVGAFLQKNGIPVIPTVRWGDESTFKFCFNGLPKNSILAIATHGCIKDKEQKNNFKKGLAKMLEILKPTDVIVYGYMPDYIFNDFKNVTKFHNFSNEFEKNCKK